LLLLLLYEGSVVGCPATARLDRFKTKEENENENEEETAVSNLEAHNVNLVNLKTNNKLFEDGGGRLARNFSR